MGTVGFYHMPALAVARTWPPVEYPFAHFHDITSGSKLRRLLRSVYVAASNQRRSPSTLVTGLGQPPPFAEWVLIQSAGRDLRGTSECRPPTDQSHMLQCTPNMDCFGRIRRSDLVRCCGHAPRAPPASLVDVGYRRTTRSASVVTSSQGVKRRARAAYTSFSRP